MDRIHLGGAAALPAPFGCPAPPPPDGSEAAAAATISLPSGLHSSQDARFALVLDHISRPFFPVFCAFSLCCEQVGSGSIAGARGDGGGDGGRADGTALRSCPPAIPHSFFSIFSPFFPQPLLNDYSLTSASDLDAEGRGRKMAGGRRLVPCLLSF